MKDNWTDEAFAADWDGQHLVGNPSRPFLLSIVVEILRSCATDGAPLSIVEIGSGSGLVSDRILTALPDASIDAVDHSEPMMARAAARLARHGDRFRQIRADLSAFDPAVLGQRRYDVALILQVLHEVPREAKCDVLRQLRSRLAARGLLLYGERLRANYADFTAPHEAVWNALVSWTPDTLQPDFAARMRGVQAKSDFTTGLADELAVLVEAGYTAEPLLVLGERCLLAARAIETP